ncbi:DUF456 domain-containing protein [Chitinimonas sp. BJYL2]|uniref:DUF456 domain-containing protein n=1 Tax=Chitinimonas sp. BJYL2 TaxID=2976696 RepID=UPI0022B458E4|nr:DUF456 domain-containing protein [Chitinimonas sp. BJYL2]
MEFAPIAGWVLAILLMLAGLVGTILPLIPAAPLLFGGFLLGAWLDQFERVGWIWLGVLLILTALMAVVDFVAAALGAKRQGASRLAMVGAALGTVVGMFLGLIGLVIGPFVGAVAGEWAASGDRVRAGKVGLATWLGMLLGTVAKLVLALMMIALFAFAWAV